MGLEQNFGPFCLCHQRRMQFAKTRIGVGPSIRIGPAEEIAGTGVGEIIRRQPRAKLVARLPPDYLAHARAGDFFGWPYAYAGPNPDPRFGELHPALVAKTKRPE